MSGPFIDLRVVDLSRNRVGAQISQFLADFGADVIWVEPVAGAPLREHNAYPFWGRGKRSIAVDLRDASEREQIVALVRRADILIDTFRPGVLDRLGLGYATISAHNPGLIHTSVTGFGHQSRYADAPGYEGLVFATLGVFQAFARMSPHGVPPFVSAPFATWPASQVGLHGTLAALIERAGSGVGQRVETNLAQAFLTLDTWAWFEYYVTTRWPDAFAPAESHDADGVPVSPLQFMLLVALTGDGSWLQFAAVAPHLFRSKMRALGLEWMFDDPAWAGVPALEDPARRRELWSRMIEAVRSRTLSQWGEVFAADPDVFAEQFRAGVDILDHPQLVHDGAVIELADPERGLVRQPGPQLRAARTPAAISRPAPALDEHRAEILAELEMPAAEPVERASLTSPGALPLEGVTILELAVLFAAPHGTTMLTDLGARVIKVEKLGGDQIRGIIPFPESGGAKVMQGKESICVDTSTPEGLAIVQDIAASVDVVVQGFRAGAVERMQLDYDTIRSRNPEVIYVNAPGYGVDGPNGGRPAFAPSIGAAVGVPLVNLGSSMPETDALSTAEIQQAARRLSAAAGKQNAQADGFAALGVATAILFGLAVRARGHGGQELFTSMVSTGAHAMSAHAVVPPGAAPTPLADADLTGLGPLYRIYPTSDGPVFLAVTTDREWATLVDALAPVTQLGSDPRFATRAAREANAALLAASLAAVFATAPADQWEASLLAAGVGAMAVHTGRIEQKLIDDAFGHDSGYVVETRHPTFDGHPRLAPFLAFSRSRTQALAGVLAGQHTDVILAALGRAPAEIADLRSRAIVG